MFILDQLLGALPNPPYTPDMTEALSGKVFDHIWDQSAGGGSPELSTVAA